MCLNNCHLQKQVHVSRLRKPYESKCIDSWEATNYTDWVIDTESKYSLVVRLTILIYHILIFLHIFLFDMITIYLLLIFTGVPKSVYFQHYCDRMWMFSFIIFRL